MLLTVAATTSCVYNTPGGDEELTLLIRFSPTHPFRAIEQGAANNSYTVGTYKPITLFFYDAQGNPTEPYRIELKSKDDIDKAMGDGYEIKVRQSVAQVSAVAGRSGVLKPDNLNTLSIYDLQDLGGAEDATKSFLHSVPYVAPKASVKALSSDPKKLTVELQPVPNVARLEISGNITIPKESQQAIADEIVTKRMKTYPGEGYSYVASPCELPIRYITDFTIRGIYVNNYKETFGATKRNFLDSAKYDLGTHDWTGHNDKMHTLFDALNGTKDYAKTMTAGMVDAYQIYPGKATDPEALDHVIVEVEYKLHTRVGYFDAMVYNYNKEKSGYVYACSRVEEKPVQELRRFITIRKFLVTNTEKSLVSFDPGKIYRIDLSDLSTLFSMNVKPDVTTIDGKTEITPGRERTDERPEETSAAVRVDVSGWTHININTELE